MKWYERIRKARKERRLRREDVAEAMRAYLPEGETVSTRTLASWELGDSEPRISHAIALSKVYGIENVTQLFFDDPAAAILTAEGQELLGKFQELLQESPRYTRKLRRVEPVKPEPARPEPAKMRPAKAEPAKTEPVKNVRQLPLYDIPASAGTGDFLDSDRCEMVDVDDDVPLSADFGLKIAGDSMMPTLENGQTVWVRQQMELRPGEIGIFWLNGSVFCKELAQDEEGYFLYSHNPKYSPIRIGEYDELRVFGRVVG